MGSRPISLSRPDRRQLRVEGSVAVLVKGALARGDPAGYYTRVWPLAREDALTATHKLTTRQ
jgi:hypothetical protein